MSLVFQETANKFSIIINEDRDPFLYRKVVFKKSQFTGFKMKYDNYCEPNSSNLELYLTSGQTITLPFLRELKARYIELGEKLSELFDQVDKKND